MQRTRMLCASFFRLRQYNQRWLSIPSQDYCGKFRNPKLANFVNEAEKKAKDAGDYGNQYTGGKSQNLEIATWCNSYVSKNDFEGKNFQACFGGRSVDTLSHCRNSINSNQNEGKDIRACFSGIDSVLREKVIKHSLIKGDNRS